MSVVLNLKQVTPATLDFIINHTESLNYLLFEQDSNFQPKPPELQAVLSENDAVEPVDLEKAWTGILFLLNDFPEVEGLPPVAVVLGLNGVGPEEDEEETARYLRAEEVKTLAPALTEISKDKFFENYDAKTMNELEIYPVRWDEVNSEGDKEYLWEYFTAMQNYYRDAADRGNAMIIFKS